jgi:hypothetical protein
MGANTIAWPEGKRFAFSIFDDTDRSTLRNTPLIYQFLHEQGFRTTKSVWPVKGSQAPRVGGDTCADPEYYRWVRTLQAQGFEIALHNVTYHTSNRQEVIAGLDQFCRYFGSYPAIHANHVGCQENIYFGDARLSGFYRWLYNVITRYQHHRQFFGEVPGSDLFWGDICQANIKYVRNFVYLDANTLKQCPYMPYHDPARPYVNYWFASSDGSSRPYFNQLLDEENQDRLEDEGGCCLVYTHFGSRFVQDGQINQRFQGLMTRLSQKNGWFAAVSTILDYIISTRGPHTLTPGERMKLEQAWLKNQVRLKISRKVRSWRLPSTRRVRN